MDPLKSASAIADSMRHTARDASDAYLAARKALLAAEVELRRQMERVAEQRRALPPGPIVREDYVFDGLGADGEPTKVKLSELFRPGADALLIYCYMFPRHPMDDPPPALQGEVGALPIDEQPCPSCTGLLDQLDGAVPHFEAGGANFTVVTRSSLDKALMVARDRGWRNLRLLSAGDNGFKRAFHAEEEDGGQIPMTLAFKRESDGTIRLTWASELVWADKDPGQDHRAAGTIEPFWNMFDLLPSGRPQAFNELLEYSCCDGKPAPVDTK